jgi:hypothetical protein
MVPFIGVPDTRVLRRESQLLLRFSGKGSRRLKPIWASLTVEGV